MMWMLLACSEPEGWTPQEIQLLHTLSPIPAPPASPTNEVADSLDAALLGLSLFADTKMSADGQTACDSCHLPGKHFTDGLKAGTTARGTGKRNTPTVLGAAWNTWFFWDGRADSAWSQATGPLLNPIEHASSPEQVHARIKEAYTEPFTKIFGGVSEDPMVVLSQVGKAIEAYERTLSPGPARFDRYIAALGTGKEKEVFTPQEEEGLKLFIGEAGCINCHNGPLFTDRSFHNLSLPLVAGVGLDNGRATGAREVLTSTFRCGSAYAATDSRTPPCPELRYLAPEFPDWPAAFKTPSLRNVADTAPYMHDGSIPDLKNVLFFYNLLPGQEVIGHRELTLQPLRISQEQLNSLEAFLLTLSKE